ncbi:DUF1045 domain-containing protein [Rhizobium sp. RU36D]|uniref:DUF1045 domain-containing protein n=1 Tax=Rhizobium sp. RU36D TaxID=1907415 RepID=UPI0009D8B062|nr:DUF1045 domain-containing protein [Rhizobium sp. RU36D]SMD02931.1 putative phosphonate metabolism protein [Rhizobium sp. RU36D]
MRYAIFFTPPPSDPLTLVAASWLGRNAYSDAPVDHPDVRGLGIHEIAYYTAMPRRYGFHATIKAPFRLNDGMSESALLRDMMRFAGTIEPFEIPRLEVLRLGDHFGLAPARPCDSLQFVSSAVIQEFDAFRAPLSEAEIERRNPDGLSATQFANLHRWGDPYVMEEYRFRMTLTGPVGGGDMARVDRALHALFDPLLEEPVVFSNLALFIEREVGAPFQVHSLHPMGRVSARRIA